VDERSAPGWTVTFGVGMWDIEPVFEGLDDILTTNIKIVSPSVKITENLALSAFLLPRYYWSDESFLGDGWNISTGVNASYKIADKISLGFGPFISKDSGFGVDPGWTLGTNLGLTYSLTDDVSLSLNYRILTPITDNDNDTVDSFGLSWTRRF